MSDPFAILRMAPLLLAGGVSAFRGKTISRDITGSLARVGYGLVKLLYLLVLLEEVFSLSLTAAPSTKTSWASFIGMVSFTGMLYLLVSGTADVYAGLLRLVKYELPEVTRDPFWADGFMDFWGRWGTVAEPEPPSFRSALNRCGLVLLTVVIWGGFNHGMGVWMVLQAGLIYADSRLATNLVWTTRVPRLVRRALTVLLFTLSTPLLYAGTLEAAVQEWTRLFNPPSETLYSVFLDQRLTTPRASWLLWAAVLVTLATPGLRWWMGQGPRLRLAVKATGLFFLGMSMFICLEPILPGIAVRLVLGLYPDGRNGVVIGNDGRLYAKRDLDIFTQRRSEPTSVDAILALKQHLQAQGTGLLVLPVPEKLTLYPEPILPGKYWTPVLPPDYRAGVDRLRAAGVDVLDLSGKLWDQRNRLPLYFKQNSLWRAEAMKEIAVLTSRHIRKTYPQAVRDETPLIDAVFIERQDVGELAKTLDFANAARFWSAEVTQMVGLRGLKGGETSPVLVIGGTLIRVYDDPSLSFGPASATEPPSAFPTQLGALLGQGLDIMDESKVQTADPSFPRTQGKKLVIWVIRAGDL